MALFVFIIHEFFISSRLIDILGPCFVAIEETVVIWLAFCLSGSEN